MITPAYVRLMAQYNAEMNRRLYAAAARLTDAERKADRGAFWQSIHGTLTHILWGDTQWMSRFDALAEARRRPEAERRHDGRLRRAANAARAGRCRHLRLGQPRGRCLAGRGPGVVQRLGRQARCGDRRGRWWRTSSTIRRITAAKHMRCSPPAVRTPATPICSWWCPTRPDRSLGVGVAPALAFRAIRGGTQ